MSECDTDRGACKAEMVSARNNIVLPTARTSHYFTFLKRTEYYIVVSSDCMLELLFTFVLWALYTSTMSVVVKFGL